MLLSEPSAQILFSLLEKIDTEVDVSFDAYRRVHQILKNNNLSMRDIISNGLTYSIDVQDISEANNRILALEEKLAKFEVKGRDYYTFEQLREAVVKMNSGTQHGWQSALSEASKGSSCGEISLALIQRWRQQELIHKRPSVPRRYFDAIALMKFPRTTHERMKYSEQDHAAFKEAFTGYQRNPDSKSYYEISLDLSEELHRRITENSVKSEFHRIKVFSFAVMHLKSLQAIGELENKTMSELVSHVSDKIGSAVSKKIIQSALDAL